jgi:predicted Zn-dependent protease
VHNRFRVLRSQALAVLALFVLASPGVVVAGSNPYDKFRDETYSNKGLMSEQQEVQLGAQMHQQVLQKFRLVEDPEVSAYVQNLGERLARSSKRPDIPYRFYVIDDQSVNAFALPGGYIYVHSGLLRLAESEDELAAAMAHEIGHVAARHGLRNVKKAQRTAMIFGILGVGAEIATGGSGAGRAASAASQLFAAGLITKNSRDFEREADYLGLYNMRQAGEQPAGMVRIFERLDQARSAKSSQMGGIFASHPDAKERVRNTKIEIDQRLGGASVAQAAPAGTGRTRARRVGGGGQVAYANTGGDAAFQNMKQALAGYVGGNRGYRQQNPRYGSGQSRYPQQQGRYPDEAPATNDRPVLKRRN